MKRHHVRAGSPRKLAIDKTKLRVVPTEQLADVNGAGDPPRPAPPSGDTIGSWY